MTSYLWKIEKNQFSSYFYGFSPINLQGEVVPHFLMRPCDIIWPLRIRQQLNGLSTTKIDRFTISKIRSSLTLWPTMPYKSSYRSIFIALQLCFLVKTCNFVSLAVILVGTQFWPKNCDFRVLWKFRTQLILMIETLSKAHMMAFQ